MSAGLLTPVLFGIALLGVGVFCVAAAIYDGLGTVTVHLDRLISLEQDQRGNLAAINDRLAKTTDAAAQLHPGAPKPKWSI